MGNITIPTPDFSDAGLFSSNTILFLIMCVAIFFIIKYSAKKAVDIVVKILGLIVLFQILYIIGLTPMDQYLHISSIFKYDFFTTLAAIVPGTVIADILTKVGTWLTQFMVDVVNWILNLPSMFANIHV